MTIKTLLRYPGGKSRAVDELIGYFPEGLSLVVSPFLGGASLELALARKGVRVVGGDLFPELVCFWNAVLNNKTELAEKVKEYHPLSKERFYSLQKELPTIVDELEKAAVFYVINRSSFSGATLSGGMSPDHPRFTESSIQRILDFEIENFEVICSSFSDTMNEYPEAFLYLDPPYWTKQSLYGVKGNLHKGFNHVELAESLKKRDNWILSYNNCPEVLEAYKDYTIIYPKWAYGMTKDKSSKEVLILNIKEGKNE